MSNKKLLVYGSLREGEYNYERFNCKTVKTGIPLEGFILVDRGPYPYAVPKDKGYKNTTIIVDIIDVDERTAKSIEYMEIAAGYRKINVTLDGENYPMYVYNYYPDGGPVVESGDWSEYLKTRNKEG